MEHGDAIAEALAETSERLRRERDLRHEHDRAAAACERGFAGADVHLRLAAAGRAPQEDVAAAGVEQLIDPRERVFLRRREVRGRSFRLDRVADDAPLAATLRERRCDERERTRRRRAVVVGDPERELDECRRQRLGDALDRGRVDAFRQFRVDLRDDAAPARLAEEHLDHVAHACLIRDLVREGARNGAGRDERVHGGVAAHRSSLAGGQVVRLPRP